MATITVEQALELATTHHQAGRLPEAETICRQILATFPDHADALHLLGVLVGATGRHEEAVHLLARAITLSPAQPFYHGNAGVILRRSGRLEEAVASFHRALALRADLPHLHFNLGDALLGLRRFDEAVASFRSALALQPDHAEAHHNLATALAEMDQPEQAIASYRGALALQPADAHTLSNLGMILLQTAQTEEAISCLRQAVALRPELAALQANLGIALALATQHGEAIACFQRALTLAPDRAATHHHLGMALLEMERWDEAISSFERTISLQPDHAEAHTHLGIACARTGQFQRAVACHQEAIRSSPALAVAHSNLGQMLLLLGHYREGWREYEWRRRSPALSTAQQIGRPWRSEPVPGETLLLRAEQGFGDTIQFLRYVPGVRKIARAKRIILECPQALFRLVAGTGDWDVDLIASAPAPPSDPDLHVSLPSLPHTLGIAEPLPMSGAYLRAAPNLRETWRERLAPPETLRVGLAWAGSPENTDDRRRSIPFRALAPLLRVPRVTFYSLQVAPTHLFPEQLTVAGLIDLTAHLTDFADTAALTAELDLIISVDTATAHLAGALGRPVWTLLSSTADWRWGLGPENTPWYPTMRLFRQTAAGDWDTVLQRVAEALTAYAAGVPPTA